MDDLRIGAACRALRRRLGWRQSDLAERVGISQDLVSRLECGHAGGMDYGTIQRIFAALGARFNGAVSWRGGELDRVLDERHARIVGQVTSLYREYGWDPIPEASFQSYGDRGSIDVLGLHPETRSASINEIKSDIFSVEETHRRHDVKVRLAAQIVEQRVGWRPTSIGRILILPEESRVRRAIARHEAVFRAAYPADSRQVRGWIRKPEGPLAGIWFLSPAQVDRVRQVPGGPKRVRVARQRTPVPRDPAARSRTSVTDAHHA